MTTETPHIDYEAMAQDAMRGLVREVLIKIAKSGLPGDHHFYVSFDTTLDDVTLSKRLKEKYPNEMTIVLQHRFWDLHVFDDRFEVKLTFDGIPERLIVPFHAIKVFFDPSVRYGLQFGDPEEASESNFGSIAKASDDEHEHEHVVQGLDTPQQDSPKVTAKSRRTQSDEKAQRRDVADEDLSPVDDAATTATGAKTAKRKTKGQRKKSVEDGQPILKDGDAANTPGGAEILSLDAFRKK